MEDDIKINKKWKTTSEKIKNRRPQKKYKKNKDDIKKKWKMTSKKNEDDLKKK